jgi:hypothetical protein
MPQAANNGRNCNRFERWIMSSAILDPLMYVSVVIYFIYILVDGWHRLAPVF